MSDRPRIKICGLRRREDVEAADALGVAYVGVVLSGGFGRSVDPREARALVAGVSATPVAVLVDEAPAHAVALARGLGAGVVQLHGDESPEDAARIRAAGPWEVWKAVRATRSDDVVAAAARFGASVHGLLVEGAREGVVGGGGASVGGDVTRLRDLVPGELALILAGGLTPVTVGGAVNRHGPDVVDVSSGVEVEFGRKDHELLRSFVSAVRATPSSRPIPGEHR